MEKSFQVSVDLLGNSLNWVKFCEVGIFLQRVNWSKVFITTLRFTTCLFWGTCSSLCLIFLLFFFIIWMAFDCLERSWAPALTWQRDVSVSVNRCIPPRLFHVLHPSSITTAFIVASDRSSCRHWWKTWPSLHTHDLQWVWPSNGN